jgi:hypothetical protein
LQIKFLQRKPDSWLGKAPSSPVSLENAGSDAIPRAEALGILIAACRLLRAIIVATDFQATAVPQLLYPGSAVAEWPFP